MSDPNEIIEARLAIMRAMPTLFKATGKTTVTAMFGPRGHRAGSCEKIVVRVEHPDGTWADEVADVAAGIANSRNRRESELLALKKAREALGEIERCSESGWALSRAAEALRAIDALIGDTP